MGITMQKNPQISVVIPLYNKAPYIGRALDSVLAQGFQDFEIIVVDDASIDGGSGVVRSYKDNRISLYRRDKASPGGHAARNLGIRKARAGLVAFLDADDEWTPQFLQTVIDLRHQYPGAGAYTTSYLVYGSGGRSKAPVLKGIPREKNWQGIIPDYFFSVTSGSPPFCTISVAIPVDVFHNVDFFPEGVSRGGDHDMWARIALRYDIAFSSEPCAVYYKNIPGSVVKTNKVLHGYRVVETLEKFIAEESGTGGKSLRHIQEYIAKNRLGSATQCIKAGESLLARKHLRECRTKRFLLRRFWLFCCACMPGWMKPGRWV